MTQENNHLKDLVIKSVKDGIEHEETITDESFLWFRRFSYSEDPLDDFTPERSFTPRLIKLFVNRDSEVKFISGYFGKAKKLPYNIHIAIIGSKGSGKHTTLKIITSYINESFPEISFEFYNLEFSFNYKANESMSQKEVNNLDNKELDVRVVSCSGKNKYLFLKRIKDYKENTKLTFSIWHTRDFPSENDMHVNREIYFNNFSRNDIVEIFKRRVNEYLIQSLESKPYHDILINELLPKMAKSFQGNLNVCFLFFKEIHQQARIMNLKTIPSQLIENLINSYLAIKNQKITSKEQEIIDYYLKLDNRIYITTPDLKDDLDYDRTIAWKYLENLTKKHVFRKIKYGNPSRYQIHELFLSFYEDTLQKKFIFKEE
ncbi:MAG: hypothetical protein ACFFCI_07455 [Promethearchaeota archaeon]